jgi:hypothetical protein
LERITFWLEFYFLTGFSVERIRCDLSCCPSIRRTFSFIRYRIKSFHLLRYRRFYF